MYALKRLTFAIVAMGIAAPSLAAAQTAVPSDGELMVGRVQASVRTRVEYCLRNLPELREQLSLAHATYSLAAAQAAQILKRRYPGSNRNIRFEKQYSAVASDFDLKQARSEGFERLCPSLITYMHNATGESLAKEYGDAFARSNFEK